MIAVDTSALLAIALEEPQGQACAEALASETSVIISAGTLAELLIVAGQKGIFDKTLGLIEDLALDVITVTPAAARRTAQAYQRWGKGVHPAALNFGDCFAYEVAKENDCPLLYVGNDFAQTDIKSALQPQ